MLKLVARWFLRLSGWEAEGGVGCRYGGESKDLSTGGVYLSSYSAVHLKKGDILRVSIPIPRESRRRFPFSRVVGLARVVRVRELSAAPQSQLGLALEFLGQQIRLFGAI